MYKLMHMQNYQKNMFLFNKLLTQLYLQWRCYLKNATEEEGLNLIKVFTDAYRGKFKRKPIPRIYQRCNQTEIIQIKKTALK